MSITKYEIKEWKERLDKETDQRNKFKLIWGWKDTLSLNQFIELIEYITH